MVIPDMQGSGILVSHLARAKVFTIRGEDIADRGIVKKEAGHRRAGQCGLLEEASLRCEVPKPDGRKFRFGRVDNSAYRKVTKSEKKCTTREGKC